MILKDFKPFVGQHCETTTTGTLLYQLGIELSEPMLFGLGEALGYIYWNMKIMDFPFIGGRIRPDELTENLCRNLELKIDIKETASIKKAWTNVQAPLDQGKAVGLKLDCYHLEYFNTKIHFAGHYAAMYGYDDQYAYLVDTDQQGGQVRTLLKNMELARNEKGSMSSKNKSFTIAQEKDLPDMKATIKKAIQNNASTYLNPPIKNFGYKGIHKTATEIKKWFKNSKDVETEFTTSATLMERAGTGGALFRNLYRDFLKESTKILDSNIVDKAGNDFENIAILWTEISKLFEKVGKTRNAKYLDQASEIFLELSEKEKAVMELLSTI